MRAYHDYYKNFEHYFKTDLSRLELTIWLHALGRGMIGIFIPIILYLEGIGISSIILFYFLYNLFDVPLNFVARDFVLRVGAKNTVILGIFSEIVYFLILYAGNFSWFWLIALALSGAIFDTFYWVAHWFVLNRCIKTNKGSGKQIGFVKIIRKIGALISPAIGAFFLIFLTRDLLILAVVGIFILALIPLSTIRLEYMKPRKKRKLLDFFEKKIERKNLFRQALRAVHSTAEGELLPLFIFITFVSVEIVGVLPMIASVAGIVFIYYMGRISDRVNRDFLILIGAVLIGTCWIIRILFPNIPIFYITTLLIGFFTVFLVVPMDADLVDRAQRRGFLNTSTYRNATHMGSNALLFGLLYLSVEIFKISFSMAVFAMVILSLVSGLALWQKGMGSKTGSYKK